MSQIILVSCSTHSQENISSMSKSESNNIYDPIKIKVGDMVGKMKVKSVDVRDYLEGQPIVDIEFESDVLDVSGTFHNGFIDSNDATFGISFVPDEESKKSFPIHNLFEHEIVLNLLDDKYKSMLGTNVEGKAKINRRGAENAEEMQLLRVNESTVESEQLKERAKEENG